MLDLAEARRADLVMALQSVPDVGRSGNVVLGEDERVIGFVEKGTNTGVGLINAGVYLLRKEIVSERHEDDPIFLELVSKFPEVNG